MRQLNRFLSLERLGLSKLQRLERLGLSTLQRRKYGFSSRSALRLAPASTVRIGRVEIPLGRPRSSAEKQTYDDDGWLIPSLFLPSSTLLDASSSTSSSSNAIFLKHLQWMMAKDQLQQDMLLVGPPGAGECFRRRLALAYAELTQKPMEILTISGDLTESDLKQRRELVQNHQGSTTVEFVDQAPVRAAKHGRLLLLDGIEKAERNVLPTLNNLLENREMYLEDGTLLLPPHRVDDLSQSATSSSWIPVHPDFRVIALGVPSPPFPGRSLDPPIRSRFQIRRVDNPSSEQLYEQLVVDNDVSTEQQTLAKACAVLASVMQDNRQFFPFNNLSSVFQTLARFPQEDERSVIRRAYPLATKKELNELVQYFDKNQSNKQKRIDVSRYTIQSLEALDGTEYPQARVTFDLTNGHDLVQKPSVVVPSGRKVVNSVSSPNIVYTIGFRKALAAMVQEHASGKDILLLSPKGEGKNALANEFASMLGYKTHLFAIYSEMTSQDLLLRRGTDASTGETIWEESPLLRAARNGDVCILDGIEKLRPDVLASLQSLSVDRFIPLPDGRRVAHRNVIDPKDAEVPQNSIPVHPSFRIIALAATHKAQEPTSWMTATLMSMFKALDLPHPTEECYRAILKQSATHAVPDQSIDSILTLRRLLTKNVADECGVAQLSTRNMIRTIRRVNDELGNDLYHVLSSIFLFALLPPRQRALLESVLEKAGIQSRKTHGQSRNLEVSIDDDIAKVGNLKIPRGCVQRPELVPSPNAFDIPAHVQIIHDLLTDWVNGERYMLLLGNQGVGKNKLIDRLCQIGNWEREYIQLHRDSTIGQLTLTPQLEDGQIVWSDSPLIKAVKNGSVLVVDEADKAPVEVVSVLKGLVEDGELLLADGRRISRHNDGPDIIPIHPNFSLWVLANRPGIPFQGNDFFREIGDCFSVRVISNPDLDSEMSLLQYYAPTLDPQTIRSVAASFAELRQFADHGDIVYPYSTREAIAVVKHLEKYPDDGIVTALHNVLDFDSYDDRTYSLLCKVFQRHGIPVSDYQSWKEALSRAEDTSNGKSSRDLRIEYLDPNGNGVASPTPPPLTNPKFGKWDENNEAHVGGNQWAGGTGGSNTAGLGGRGGPFRLDRGHKVHQVSDEAKAEVSKETKEAARQMAKKALEDRLKEIGMGDQEWSMYERFSNPIQEDISKLRGILEAIELKSSERSWVKRQSYGEIDDTKLIDGVTGDKHIYKRRGSIEDAPFGKKKRIRFVMDCSGSMYRFNGYDQRLVRCLEAALLIMESFDGFNDSNKFEYSIVGHSGDSPCIPFVDWSQPPANELEKMRVLQAMHAHSQYCMSGDYTLEAVGNAIEHVSSTGDNDGTVICLSDANLARYGIDPRQLGNIVEAGTQRGVSAYVVFIASFGEEAQEIKQSLPVGRGFLCMETSEVPRIVRDILTSRVLK